MVLPSLAVMTVFKYFWQRSISFLNFSDGIFFHAIFVICSNSWTFAGFLSPMPNFSWHHRISMWLRSGLIAGQFKTVYFLIFNHSFVSGWCRGLLSCWSTYDLRFKPNFLHWLAYFALKSLGILRFHDSCNMSNIFSTRCNKAVSQH